MDDLLLPASLAATFLNLLVIFCAFRLQRRRAAGDDSANLFIMNMAFGDLLLTLFTFPNEFLIRKHSILRQIPFCAMNHFCNWLGLAVSALSLTLLNLDKLYFFRCNRTLPTALSLLLCLAVWAISFSFVAYIWIQEIVFVQQSDCALHMSEGTQYYYEIFVILFSILPVTSSLMLSFYLLKFIRNLDAPSQTNMATPFRDKLKSLVFIFATTAWTSFSLLPYRIFNICRIHIINWENSGCEERHILNWLAWILLYLLTLNPIVNPLITTIVYAPYRLYLKKLLLSIPGLPKSIHSRTGGDTQTGTENMNHSHISIRKFRRRGEKLQQMEMAKSTRGNGH